MGRNNLKVKRCDTVNIPVIRNKNNPIYSKFSKIWDMHSVSCLHRQLVFFTVLLVIYVYMFLHILLSVSDLFQVLNVNVIFFKYIISATTEVNDTAINYSPVVDFRKYDKKTKTVNSNTGKSSEINGPQKDKFFYVKNDRICYDLPILDKSKEFTDIVVKANKQKQTVSIQDDWDGETVYHILSHHLQVPVDKMKIIHKGKILRADNIREFICKKAVFQVFGERAEDASGVDDRDIELMMRQLNISRNEAIAALKEYGDVIDAMLQVGHKQ